ncbi:NACHT, LRR and PYD domains-containing protein 3-like isoform X2 [Trichomycterus rosablanca]|uniref:NACHT, LRR and PYD domains-containing protein 3-like isoform X2 n=1 Tax=Trichomycterus rosablanca TaxID=2290929 RepID=UPI002F35B2F6
MKSEWSVDEPLDFREPDKMKQKSEGTNKGEDKLLIIFQELEKKFIVLMKNELQKFKKLLSPDYPACFEREVEDKEDQSDVRDGMLKITLHILKNMNQINLANNLLKKFSFASKKLRRKLKDKFQKIHEGISGLGTTSLLNEIYTDLYITEGESGDVNDEHEVRQIESASRRSGTPEKPIKCNDLFKEESIRTVLTKGIAGIGKTVSVQKVVLDWAEGNANQDVSFMFPLPFRELNLMKEKKFSLMELLHFFFPQTMNLKPEHLYNFKILFIFDGLDECRLPLDFQNNVILSDVTESASVDVLLTNLIKGNLLSSALLWITTRPAAANQIPPECVDQVTEVRGFSDPQKEEYFRKRISDENLANRIITHMKSSRSLYIMCHIPVFCWISASVLERMLSEAESLEVPRTLTQMFTHFLIFQIKHRNQKYDRKSEIDPERTRRTIQALGKLAFQQLEKGNLIFYEEDLRECGIDVIDVSVYSGVCNQIFREEFGLHLGKVFSFVHLSVQEFLAALYAFLTFILNNTDVLQEQTTGFFSFFTKSTMSDFLKRAVNKALQSDNGHLDLFLRFLLGLSLESNQNLLRELLPQTGSRTHRKEETVRYIKERIEENLSPEKSINLFHCLNEMNDHSLVQEIQTYLNRRADHGLSGASLSPAQWSALAFVLLNSDEELDEFDLSEYNRSDECLVRMLPVIKASRKATLSYCNLTDESCEALSSVLSSESSRLTELILNNNNLQDSGVKKLCAGLRNPHCNLEILRLGWCRITAAGFTDLVSALILNPSSHLRELNLNYNQPGDLGMKQIQDLLKDPNCILEKLELEWCWITGSGFTDLVSALILNPSSHLRELNLNHNHPGDSGVKKLQDLLKDPNCKLEKLQFCDLSELKNLDLRWKHIGDPGVKLLSDLLKDPNCKAEKLWLYKCDLTDESCEVLSSVLSSESSRLTELNLNDNNLQDSGVKKLCAGLQDPHCNLEILGLESCSITAAGFTDLVSALILNPSSHLRELNLNYNQPGDSGVKKLQHLLKDPNCKLEKLQLESCRITAAGFTDLVSALILNPSSHLRELNLNLNQPGDSGVKQLCRLLKDSNCKLRKLELMGCCITAAGFTDLVSALILNPSSHLRELNLNHNQPGDSGVKELQHLLKHPNCKLEKLELADCRITAAGFTDLVSALILNPSSHLRELNLNYNQPGDSGVKKLQHLLKHPNCKLEKLQLEWCRITAAGFTDLVSALILNPSSHLRELNLNYNQPGDSGVKKLQDLLKDPNCKLEKLELERCSITAAGFTDLVSALILNPSSHLRELNLNYNQPGDSGVKKLQHLLKHPNCKLEKLE